MFYKPPKYLFHFFLTFRPGTDMNCKQSFLGKCRFYKLEQAMELLTNMSDCEDESTSESENEGDSSDSSEDAPEQHQVRTDSNILMPKETEVSKGKEILNKGQKAAPNWLIIRVPQSMLYWLIKQQQHQVFHWQKYLKYLKPKKYQKRAKKLHQNWLIIRVPQRPWHPIVI